MANYITNIPGSTIDQYLQEGHEALSKANSAVKTLGNTQTATAVTILGATSTIVPAATQIPAATTTKAGVMSAEDKAKLDGIDPNNIQSKRFDATYGTTTYQEIVNAKNAGKDVVCNYGGILYHRATEVNGEFINVRKDPDGRINVRWLNVDTSNAWTHGNYELYKESAERQKYINAGATYNAATGYYSLNGLTDITEEQMSVIYADTYRKQCGLDLSSIYAYSKARTNFPMRNRGNNEGEMKFRDACFFCQKLEVVKYGEVYKPGISGNRYYGYTTDISEAFYNCVKLKQIIGVIDTERITDAGKASNAFYNCNLLEDVQILGLKTSLDLQSPVISYDSLRFLVDHAANTTAITVTVDVHVWNWLTGGSFPPEGHTPEEWQAINSDAVAKNISFAY